MVQLDLSANERLMIRRMLQDDPWTLAEVTRAGGDERMADRFQQKLRRKGWATCTRFGQRTLWVLTDDGREALTKLVTED